ncbi:MAG: hypothetical protein V2A61_01565 [Calditrichota bacterium]
MSRQEPRCFYFIPRYYKPERGKKIKIQRITIYQPNRLAGRKWLFIALLLIVIVIVYLLGGIKPRAQKIELRPQDAVVSFSGVDTLHSGFADSGAGLCARPPDSLVKLKAGITIT